MWHKKGLPPAHHQPRGVYSFLTGSRCKTKKIIYFTQCRVMSLLAAGYALAGARSLWLQKESGEIHRRKILWELRSFPPAPQIHKLKTNEGWESSLPKVMERPWYICFVLILFHKNRILGAGKSALTLRALYSTFIRHWKLEIYRNNYFYKPSCKTRSLVDMWLSLLVVRLICQNPIALSPVMAITFK